MAPAGRGRRRKTQYKRCIARQNKEQKPAEEEFKSNANSPSKPQKKIGGEGENCGMDNEQMSECSTPKAQRFRIPEDISCPPAPKKRRSVAASAAANLCSSHRSSITFFTSPELDLFFLSAIHDISV